MSEKYHYESGAIHNDNHKELNIGSVSESTLNNLISQFFKDDAVDAEVVEEERPHDTEDNEKDPYVALLKKLISPVRESKDWKTILCPYKAAIIEGVLPRWPHKVFVSQMGIQVPSATYSEWISHDKYNLNELEPFSERFKALKRQIENSK